MFIEFHGKIGDVEVGVVIISQGLELLVVGHLYGVSDV